MKNNLEINPAQEINENIDAKSNNITPMLQQYLDIKAKHPDYLLFFRMGDFFELFFDDAVNASKALDIVLTRRGKAEGQDIPMCGVPVHAYENYLHKLVKQGFRVAICDQTETPEEAKKRGGYKALVNREIIRIITAGTITEDNLLATPNSNYLICINKAGGEGNYNISACDISTGEFEILKASLNNLFSEIEKISPSEILILDSILQKGEFRNFFDKYKNIISSFSENFFEFKKCERKIKDFYEVKTLEGISFFDKSEIQNIGGLLEYIEITQIGKKPKLNLPKKKSERNYLEIDASTLKNLEIFESQDNDKKTSLYNILNNTVTASGARNLQKILKTPFRDKNIIEGRLDAVEFFINNLQFASDCKNILKQFADVERILSRMHLNRTNPRDMLALKNSLEVCFKLKALKNNISSNQNLIEGNFLNIKNLDELFIILNTAIEEVPATNINDGGFIKNGFNPKLDDYRNAKEKSEEKQKQLQDKYIKQTGIANLKIKENNVIGAFIEITASQIDKAIPEFIHRQTLANNVRYSSEELRKIENELINSRVYAVKLEKEIFENLRQEIIKYSDDIKLIAKAVGEIDVFINFALQSFVNNYCKPKITEENKIEISEGKHPVIESFIKYTNSNNSEFIPNDLTLNKKSNIWLLTGPNMSGKSTFLRQNAIILIMAHCGCFIPAKNAEIGLCDRVYSRVGASDNLAKGHSTFMVEMVETATILNTATEKSFIILDEIGRGTATFDGVSIAWSCLEYIAQKIKARTIFATHYHELTELAKQIPTLSCYRTKITDWEGEIIFHHKIEEGTASQSYGIHVAKLAGLPKEVILRADKILNILQTRNKGNAIEVLTEELPLFNIQ